MAKLTLIVNGRRTTALANAIFGATGVRLRSVPLTPAKLKAVLPSA